MTKRIDYLTESAYPGGTYSSMILSDECKEQLFSFCASQEISNLVQPEDYHCTLVYSKTPCDSIADEDYSLPCEALVKGYNVLGDDTKVLVLELYCPNATRLHNVFCDKHGASHDYPEYIPHITISTEFDGTMPIEIPDFPIVFTDRVIEELE